MVLLFLGIQGWLPGSAPAFVFLAALVVLSVQWGRGVWFRSGALHGLAATANVLAIVAVLPVTAGLQATMGSWEDAYHSGGYSYSESQVPDDGVLIDGSPVSNIYAYDAEGNPLQDVQLFDEAGRPIRTSGAYDSSPTWTPETGEPWMLLSRPDADGRTRWNVYPLLGAPESTLNTDGDGIYYPPVGGVTPRIPPAPFAKAPALDAAPSTDADPAAPTPSASASASAAPPAGQDPAVASPGAGPVVPPGTTP